MRFPITLLSAVLFVILSSSLPAFANEPTRLAVCIRINRSGEVLQTRTYRADIRMWKEKMLAAIERASPFPPLPEGSPEYVDFHYDVVFSCTGGMWAEEMRLCDNNHGPSATAAPLPKRAFPASSSKKVRKF